LKKTSQKRAGGVAQGVGPEFKSQCHTCPKKPLSLLVGLINIDFSLSFCC
jgi:hypothetical protein